MPYIKVAPDGTQTDNAPRHSDVQTWNGSEWVPYSPSDSDPYNISPWILARYWQGSGVPMLRSCCAIAVPNWGFFFLDHCGIKPLRQRQRDDHFNAPRVRGAAANTPSSLQDSIRQGTPSRNTYF